MSRLVNGRGGGIWRVLNLLLDKAEDIFQRLEESNGLKCSHRVIYKEFLLDRLRNFKNVLRFFHDTR